MPRRLMFVVPLTLVALPAQALDLPSHKPGLWETKVAFAGGKKPALSFRRCTDEATDTLITALASGWADNACAKKDIKRNGDTMVIDSTCKVGPVTTSAHAEISGSFDSAYTLKATTREEKEAGKTQERQIMVEAQWLGPCEAHQKPGDIILPGGLTMNVGNISGLLGLSLGGQ